MYTFNELVEKAKKIHGDKYHYDEETYKKVSEPLKIICPEHGEFWQSFHQHINKKQGCPKCGVKKRSETRHDTTETFILKAKEVHGNKYDYSKVKYVDSYIKICIICSEHGEFWQKPNCHLNGRGCPKCRQKTVKERTFNKILTSENFLKKCEKKFDHKYNYDLINYKNLLSKIKIYCPKHGWFKQVASSHINSTCGCPKCSYEIDSSRKLKTTDEFIKKSVEIHGNKYDYSKVKYENGNSKVCIICPEHGEFYQRPNNHLNGDGCPKCGTQRGGIKNRLTKKEFIKRANEIHNNFYDYSLVSYKTYRDKVSIICPIHGEFSQTPDDHLQGKGCRKCGNLMSKAEDEIYNFCCEYVGKENVQQGNRIIIHPYELDIYLRSLGYAIEYNGLRWHSEKFGKDRNYHLNKLNACKKRNIKLLQIFEDEYVNHRDIVYEKLKHILKLDQNLPRIAGRKCTVKEIDKNTAKTFLEQCHIQGYVGSKVYLGAFYEDKLIAVMTFKRETKDSSKWELTRFASDYHYICQGVGGKLFKYFVKNYKPHEIKSFADRRWTLDEENNIYVQLGFKFDSYTEPDYRYFKESDGHIRQHKFGFRKDKLHKLYGLPLSMTEEEMTTELGYTRIYDCGLIKYQWKNEEN